MFRLVSLMVSFIAGMWFGKCKCCGKNGCCKNSCNKECLHTIEH